VPPQERQGDVCIGQGVVGESRVNESTYFRNVSTTVQSGTAFDTVTVRLGDGRPGDVVSWRRYKEDIQPMDTASVTSDYVFRRAIT